MVDSRWTFTVVAAELLEAGASSVYPSALVKTDSGDEMSEKYTEEQKTLK